MAGAESAGAAAWCHTRPIFCVAQSVHYLAAEPWWGEMAVAGQPLPRLTWWQQAAGCLLVPLPFHHWWQWQWPGLVLPPPHPISIRALQALPPQQYPLHPDRAFMEMGGMGGLEGGMRLQEGWKRPCRRQRPPSWWVRLGKAGWRSAGQAACVLHFKLKPRSGIETLVSLRKGEVTQKSEGCDISPGSF